MITAVIFDVDGTLVDSVDFHAEAWQRTIREFGKEVSFQDIRSQIGKGSDQLLPVFWTRAELEKVEEPLNEFRSALFKREYLTRVKGFPKVRELMELILSHGQKIALASSAAGDELQAYKKAAGTDDLIQSETSKDDADKSKPHPDIFEAALKQLGHPPKEDTIVVGDTPWDIKAADKAGMRTIGVLCGGFTRAELSGAMALFRDPADLLASFQTSPLARTAEGAS
jgi:HAD superfamily hydrolase (TIGR01509 family)